MSEKRAARIAHLEQVYPQHRNGNRGAEIRLELDRLYRESADEAEAARIETLSSKMDAISASVKSLERKEWKTLTFWIVLLTLLVASAALFRDVVDWRVFGFGSPAPMRQPPAPQTPAPPSQQSSTGVSGHSPSPQPAPPTP